MLKFKVFVNRIELNAYDNFFEAFKLFWTETQKFLAAELASGSGMEIFETIHNRCWIQIISDRSDERVKLDDMQYMAYQLHILENDRKTDDGPQLVPPPTEINKRRFYFAKLRYYLYVHGIDLTEKEFEAMEKEEKTVS